MPSKKPYIKIYLSQDEKDAALALAQKANVSISEFGKRCVSGKKLPDAHRHDDVLELVKINADLARLGNLLKLALDDDGWRVNEKNQSMDVGDVITEIRNYQGEVQRFIMEMN